MKAKIIKDGERVIITLTEIENPEDFLQKVVSIASSYSEEKIVPQEVLGLVPPVESEESEESYVEEKEEEKEKGEEIKVAEEAEDFEAPFTGKSPEEIILMPRFEGFYFLCRTKIPAKHKETCDKLLYEYAEKKKFFPPPYGETERMKKYLLMSQQILGDENLPGITETIQAVDANPNATDALDVFCECAAEKIFAFFSSKKS